MQDVQTNLSEIEEAHLIENEFNDQYFPSVNGGTFNQVGAKIIYDDFYKKAFSEERKLFIIIGTDSGLLAKYVEENCCAAESHYLFIELDNVSDSMRRCSVELPRHPQITYCAVDSWQALCKKPPLIYYLYQKNVEVIQSMAVLDGFCPDYHHVRYEVERQAQHLLWTIHMQLAGQSFVIQQCANIAENQVPAKLLRFTFSGKTAAILAGGPSLDQSLDWVKKNRDKLVVISVSRVSKRLLEVDLIPDIVVSIDPTEKMLTVSQEMLAFPEHVLFVNADHVTSHLLTAWPYRRAYLGHRFPWDQDYDSNNIPQQGPTVTNAALALAIEMGFRQICLTGTDLCYSAEGYTHAKGSAEHQNGPLLGYYGQQVTCYNGQVANTDAAFFQATMALEKQSELAGNVGCEVINLAETACAISTIPYRAANQVVLDDEPTNVQLIFDTHLPKMTEDFFLKDYKILLQQLKKAKQQCFQCQQMIEQCRELNQKSTGHNAQFAKREQQLNQQYEKWLATFKRYHMAYFQDFFGQVHHSLTEAGQVQEATEAYLSAFANAAGSMLTLLQQADKTVQQRRQEWGMPVDVTKLCELWQANNQLGRAECWSNQHSAALAQLNKAQLQKLDDTIALFHASGPMQRAAPSTDALPFEKFKQIQSKCLFLYRSKEAEALQTLLGQLQCQTSDGGKALQSLCAGYLSELLNLPEQAIECYYQAAEHALLRELALNHLTSVLIKCHDNDNALLALECLCQISQGYCLSYAKTLATTGQTESAIAVLVSYLERSPDDQQAKITLQQLKNTH